MRKPSCRSVNLLHGDKRVFKRARSLAWQATFKMGGAFIRSNLQLLLAEREVKDGKDSSFGI